MCRRVCVWSANLIFQQFLNCNRHQHVCSNVLREYMARQINELLMMIYWIVKLLSINWIWACVCVCVCRSKGRAHTGCDDRRFLPSIIWYVRPLSRSHSNESSKSERTQPIITRLEVCYSLFVSIFMCVCRVTLIHTFWLTIYITRRSLRVHGLFVFVLKVYEDDNDAVFFDETNETVRYNDIINERRTIATLNIICCWIIVSQLKYSSNASENHTTHEHARTLVHFTYEEFITCCCFTRPWFTFNKIHNKYKILKN